MESGTTHSRRGRRAHRIARVVFPRVLTPIALGLADALALLGRPLRIILENGRNDRAFVLAFASDTARRAIREAEEAGWLVFETAGGIGEIKTRLRGAKRAPLEVLRTMYLCDSDAVELDRPSASATTVRDRIAKLAMYFRRPISYFGKVLSRRAAENYAPPGDVLRWRSTAFGEGAWRLIQTSNSTSEKQTLTSGSGDAGGPRRLLLAAIALQQLPADIRAVIDMKEGRGPQEARRTTDAIWDRLDAFQQAALANGFGGGFSADFYPDRIGLRDETGEVVEFIANILERL